MDDNITTISKLNAAIGIKKQRKSLLIERPVKVGLAGEVPEKLNFKPLQSEEEKLMVVIYQSFVARKASTKS